MHLLCECSATVCQCSNPKLNPPKIARVDCLLCRREAPIAEPGFAPAAMESPSTHRAVGRTGAPPSKAPDPPAITRLSILQKWDRHVATLTDVQMCSKPVEVRQHLLQFFTVHIVMAGLEGTCGAALGFDECQVIAEHIVPALARPQSPAAATAQVCLGMVVKTTRKLAQDMLVAEWKGELLIALRRAAVHGSTAIQLRLHDSKGGKMGRLADGPEYSKGPYIRWCSGEMWSFSTPGSTHGDCFKDKECLHEFRKTCNQMGFGLGANDNGPDAVGFFPALWTRPSKGTPQGLCHAGLYWSDDKYLSHATTAAKTTQIQLSWQL